MLDTPKNSTNRPKLTQPSTPLPSHGHKNLVQLGHSRPAGHTHFHTPSPKTPQLQATRSTVPSIPSSTAAESMTSGFHFEPASGRKIRYNHIPLRFFRKRRPIDFSVPSAARCLLAARVASRYIERKIEVAPEGSHQIDGLAKAIRRFQPPDLLGKSRAQLEVELPAYQTKELEQLLSSLKQCMKGGTKEGELLGSLETVEEASKVNSAPDHNQYGTSSDITDVYDTSSNQPFTLLHEFAQFEREHMLRSLFLTRGWLSSSQLERMIIHQRRMQLESRSASRKVKSGEHEACLLRRRLDDAVKSAVGEIIFLEALRNWSLLNDQARSNYVKKFNKTPKHEKFHEIISNGLNGSDARHNINVGLLNAVNEDESGSEVDESSEDTNDECDSFDSDSDDEADTNTRILGSIHSPNDSDANSDVSSDEESDTAKGLNEKTFGKVLSTKASLFNSSRQADRNARSEKSSQNMAKEVRESRNRVRFFGSASRLSPAVRAAYLAELAKRFDDPMGEELDSVPDNDWDDNVEWTLAKWKWERYLCTCIRFSQEWKKTSSDGLFMGPSFTFPNADDNLSQISSSSTTAPPIRYPIIMKASEDGKGLVGNNGQECSKHALFSSTSTLLEGTRGEMGIPSLDYSAGNRPLWVPVLSPDYFPEIESEAMRAAWRNEGFRLFIIIAEGADGGTRFFFSRAAERREQLRQEVKLAVDQLTCAIELISAVRKSMKIRKKARQKYSKAIESLDTQDSAGITGDSGQEVRSHKALPDSHLELEESELEAKQIVDSAMKKLSSVNCILCMDSIYPALTAQSNSQIRLSLAGYNECNAGLWNYANDMFYSPLACADYDRRSPLHLIASEGHEGLAYFLLKRFSGLLDVNAKDRFGSTALDDALRYTNSIKHRRVVASLLASGAQVGDCSRYALRLVKAVKSRDYKAIELFLACGADPDTSDETGRTPLHFAVTEGDVESCKLLLHAHANPYLVESGGDVSTTPAAIASKSPDHSLKSLFAEYGHLPIPSAALTPFSCTLLFLQAFLLFMFTVFVVYAPSLRNDLTDPLFTLYSGRTLHPTESDSMIGGSKNGYTKHISHGAAFKNGLLTLRAVDHSYISLSEEANRYGPTISKDFLDEVTNSYTTSQTDSERNFAEAQSAISSFASSVSKGFESPFQDLPFYQHRSVPAEVIMGNSYQQASSIAINRRPTPLAQRLLSGLPSHVGVYVASTLNEPNHPLSDVLGLLGSEYLSEMKEEPKQGSKPTSNVEASAHPKSHQSKINLFPIFTDTHILAFMGFGYLLSFYRNRRSKSGTLGALLLVAAVVLQIYILAQGFWAHMFSASLPLYSRTTSVTRYVYYEQTKTPLTQKYRVDFESAVTLALSDNPGDVPLILEAAEKIGTHIPNLRPIIEQKYPIAGSELGASLTRVLVDISYDSISGHSNDDFQWRKVTRRIVTSTVTITGTRPSMVVRALYRLLGKSGSSLDQDVHSSRGKVHDRIAKVRGGSEAFIWDGREHKVSHSKHEPFEFDRIDDNDNDEEIWSHEFIEGFERSHSRLHDTIHTEILELMNIHPAKFQLRDEVSEIKHNQTNEIREVHHDSWNSLNGFISNALKSVQLPPEVLRPTRVPRPFERMGVARGWLPSSFIAGAGWPSAAKLGREWLLRQAKKVELNRKDRVEGSYYESRGEESLLVSRHSSRSNQTLSLDHASEELHHQQDSGAQSSTTLVEELERKLKRREPTIGIKGWATGLFRGFLAESFKFATSSRRFATKVSRNIPSILSKTMVVSQRFLSQFLIGGNMGGKSSFSTEHAERGSWLHPGLAEGEVSQLPEVPSRLELLRNGGSNNRPGKIPRQRFNVFVSAETQSIPAIREGESDAERRRLNKASTVSVRLTARRLKSHMANGNSFLVPSDQTRNGANQLAPMYIAPAWARGYLSLGSKLEAEQSNSILNDENISNEVLDSDAFAQSTSHHMQSSGHSQADEEEEDDFRFTRMYSLFNELSKLLESLVVPLSSAVLLQADICVGSIFIATVALSGYATGPRILVISAIQVAVYALNEELSVFLRTSDSGGAIILHLFGAVFGVAAAIGLGLHDNAVNSLLRMTKIKREPIQSNVEDINQDPANSRAKYFLSKLFSRSALTLTLFFESLNYGRFKDESKEDVLSTEVPFSAASKLQRYSDLETIPVSRKRSSSVASDRSSDQSLTIKMIKNQMVSENSKKSIVDFISKLIPGIFKSTASKQRFTPTPFTSSLQTSSSALRRTESHSSASTLRYSLNDSDTFMLDSEFEFELFGYDNVEEWEELKKRHFDSETLKILDTEDELEEEDFDDKLDNNISANDLSNEMPSWLGFPPESLSEQPDEALRFAQQQLLRRKKRMFILERRRLSSLTKLADKRKLEYDLSSRSSIVPQLPLSSLMSGQRMSTFGYNDLPSLPTIVQTASTSNAFQERRSHLPSDSMSPNKPVIFHPRDSPTGILDNAIMGSFPRDTSPAWIGTTPLGDPFIVSPTPFTSPTLLSISGTLSPIQSETPLQLPFVPDFDFPDFSKSALVSHLKDQAALRTRFLKSDHEPKVASAIESNGRGAQVDIIEPQFSSANLDSIGPLSSSASQLSSLANSNIDAASLSFTSMQSPAIQNSPSLSITTESPIAKISPSAVTGAHESIAVRWRKQLVLAPALGTLFMLLFWPALNAMLLPGVSQHRSVVNTMLSMSGACIAAFVSTTVLRDAHFDLNTAQHAIIAGGIACAACADSILFPSFALLLGATAGSSTVLTLMLVRKLALNRYKKRLLEKKRKKMENEDGLKFSVEKYTPQRKEGSNFDLSSAKFDFYNAGRDLKHKVNEDDDVDEEDDDGENCTTINRLQLKHTKFVHGEDAVSKLNASSARLLDMLTLLAVHAFPAIIGALFNAYLAYIANLETYGLDALSAVFPAMAQGCTSHSGVGAVAALAIASSLLTESTHVPHVFAESKASGLLNGDDFAHFDTDAEGEVMSSPYSLKKNPFIPEIKSYDPNLDPLASFDGASVPVDKKILQVPSTTHTFGRSLSSDNAQSQQRNGEVAEAYLFYSPHDPDFIHDYSSSDAKTTEVESNYQNGNIDPNTQVWFKPVPVSEAYNLIVSHFVPSTSESPRKAPITSESRDGVKGHEKVSLGEHIAAASRLASENNAEKDSKGKGQNRHPSTLRIPKGLRAIVCSGVHRSGFDQAKTQLVFLFMVLTMALVGGFSAGWFAAAVTSLPKVWRLTLRVAYFIAVVCTKKLSFVRREFSRLVSERAEMLSSMRSYGARISGSSSNVFGVLFQTSSSSHSPGSLTSSLSFQQETKKLLSTASDNEVYSDESYMQKTKDLASSPPASEANSNEAQSKELALTARIRQLELELARQKKKRRRELLYNQSFGVVDQKQILE